MGWWSKCKYIFFFCTHIPYLILFDELSRENVSTFGLLLAAVATTRQMCKKKLHSYIESETSKPKGTKKKICNTMWEEWDSSQEKRWKWFFVFKKNKIKLQFFLLWFSNENASRQMRWAENCISLRHYPPVLVAILFILFQGSELFFFPKLC